jgi:two-component system, NarL family, sensor kinase
MEASKGIEYYFAIIAGSLAFFMIAGGFVLFFIRYQKRLLFQQAQLHQTAIQYKEDLLTSNIELVEAERLRIAKDIHDELGGIFSTLSLSIHQINALDAQQDSILQNSQQLIDTGIKSVRRIAEDLMPHELELFGLQHTLENFVQLVSHSSGIQIDCNFNTPLHAMNKPVALAIYRIVQELLSNTLKHAGATNIQIDFEKPADELIIGYSDNGKGIHQTNQDRRGLGIKNIESRLIALNGKVFFNTTNHSIGYNCRIQIPMS